MALSEIRFDPKGGPVTVEVVFGYVQVGAYAVVLWNMEGKSRRKLGEGINTDQIPDVYSLPSFPSTVSCCNRIDPSPVWQRSQRSPTWQRQTRKLP